MPCIFIIPFLNAFSMILLHAAPSINCRDDLSIYFLIVTMFVHDGWASGKRIVLSVPQDVFLMSETLKVTLTPLISVSYIRCLIFWIFPFLPFFLCTPYSHFQIYEQYTFIITMSSCWGLFPCSYKWMVISLGLEFLFGTHLHFWSLYQVPWVFLPLVS